MNDFRDLILALNKFEVHYVIIGGYAVGVHYDPRTTKDLDVFIETNEENSRRIFAALKEFGAPLSGMDEAFFAIQREEWYQMGRPPFRVDVIQSIAGKDFQTAWQNKVVGTLFGAPVYVISKQDLLPSRTYSKISSHRDGRKIEKTRRICVSQPEGIIDCTHPTGACRAGSSASSSSALPRSAP